MRQAMRHSVPPLAMRHSVPPHFQKHRGEDMREIRRQHLSAWPSIIANAKQAHTTRQLQSDSTGACTGVGHVQLVGEGHSCSSDLTKSLALCKTPLSCIHGACRAVSTGDSCSGVGHDDECDDGRMGNLGMKCIDNICDHKREAGEVCDSNEDCYSLQCSISHGDRNGRCTGSKLNDPCSYHTPTEAEGDFFQNPCGVDGNSQLFCHVMHEVGFNTGSFRCSKPKKQGEMCLLYNNTIPAPSTQPGFFDSAVYSSLLAACETGSVCEVTVQGGYLFRGICEPLYGKRPGAACYYDFDCQQPYACINHTCSRPPPGSCTLGDHSSCSNYEYCDCQQGVGVCMPYKAFCKEENKAQDQCRLDNRCPLVDFGDSVCEFDQCVDETIAKVCCEYNNEEFQDNADWGAFKTLFGRETRLLCTHSIGGQVRGLPHNEFLVVQLNDNDELSVEKEGHWQFKHELAHADHYKVLVTQHPSSAICYVTQETGTGKVSQDINNVVIECVHESGASGTVAVICIILGILAAVAVYVYRVNRNHSIFGSRGGSTVNTVNARQQQPMLPGYAGIPEDPDMGHRGEGSPAVVQAVPVSAVSHNQRGAHDMEE